MGINPFFFDSFALDRNFLMYAFKQGVSTDPTGGRDGRPCALISHNGPYLGIVTGAFTTPPQKIFVGYDFKSPASGLQTWRSSLLWIRENENQHVNVTTSDDGLIRIADADNVLRFTSSVPLALGAYSFLDWRVELHATQGVVELMVEGERYFRVTGLKTRNSAAGLSGVAKEVSIGDGFSDTHTDTGRVGNLYFINGDTFGAAPLGRAEATHQALTGDASVAWTRSTGATNYTLLDDIPPSMTDYTYSTAAGTRDRFTVAAIANPKAIPLSIRLTGFGLKTDGATRKYRLTLRDGVNDAFGPDVFVGTSMSAAQVTYGERPNGSPWSHATVNALTVGPEDRT